MENTRLEQVIFAIDNNNDWHTVARFMRFIDEATALNTIKDGVQQAVGYWEGILESSYIMSKRDFDKLRIAELWAKDQQAILLVAGDTRQPCVLTTPKGEYLGSTPRLRNVAKAYALKQDAWTFVPATGRYFVTA